MTKAISAILAFILSIACFSIAQNLKELDLRAFSISVPITWMYKTMQGEDSFIGKIVFQKESLFFDCSSGGYANSLIPTEKEYLKKELWKKGGYFYKVGVTYTADFNIKDEKAAQMKKLGTTDSTLVRVEAYPNYKTISRVHLPTYTQKIKYPHADYIADLTYRDSTILVPIEIPAVIKSHNIQIDTTPRYIIKTIWPKIAGKGLTGIYFHSRTSGFNFQMNGQNLSAKNEELALRAFKTIKFKEK